MLQIKRYKLLNGPCSEIDFLTAVSVNQHGSEALNSVRENLNMFFFVVNTM